MLDFSLMLQVNLLLVKRIHLQSNMFATDVEKKAAGNSELTVVTALVGNFQSCKSMHLASKCHIHEGGTCKYEEKF